MAGIVGVFVVLPLLNWLLFSSFVICICQLYFMTNIKVTNMKKYSRLSSKVWVFVKRDTRSRSYPLLRLSNCTIVEKSVFLSFWNVTQSPKSQEVFFLVFETWHNRQIAQFSKSQYFLVFEAWHACDVITSLISLLPLKVCNKVIVASNWDFLEFFTWTQFSIIFLAPPVSPL